MEQIQRLTAALDRVGPRYLERLVTRRAHKYYLHPADSIQAFLVEDGWVFAVVGAERFGVQHTLKTLETRLHPDQFVRVHKQAIVNLAKVVELVPLFKGGAEARMQSGVRIDISRRYASVLKEKLGW